MNVCPQCGNTVQADDRFCENCGAELARQSFVSAALRLRPSANARVIIGIAAGTGTAIGIGLVVWLLFLAGSTAPTGVEVARHFYQGEVYVLVEYGDEIALFSESGAAVANFDLAREVLSSYAWAQALEGIDLGALADHVEALQQVDSGVAGVRSLSNATVDLFDELGSLRANVPLVGEVSAMGAVRDAFPQVSSAESEIRSLNSELNNFGTRNAALSALVAALGELDQGRDIVGENMVPLFQNGALASEELASTVGSVKERVSRVQSTVDDLEDGLWEASETPIIGGAIGGLASTVGRFGNELSDFADLLVDFAGDLNAVAAQLQSVADAAQTKAEAMLARWLDDPYDPRWPPTDPDRQPVNFQGVVPSGQASTSTEPTVGSSPPSAETPLVVYNNLTSLRSTLLYGPSEARIDDDDDVFLFSGEEGPEGLRIAAPVVDAPEVPAIDSGRSDMVTIEFIEEEEEKWLVTLMPLQFHVLLDDYEDEIDLHNVAFYREGSAVHSIFTFLANPDEGGRVRVGITPFLYGAPAANGVVVPIEVRKYQEETTIRPIPTATIELLKDVTAQIPEQTEPPRLAASTPSEPPATTRAPTPRPTSPPDPRATNQGPTPRPTSPPVALETAIAGGVIRPSDFDPDVSQWDPYGVAAYHDDSSMASAGATYSHAFGCCTGRLTYRFNIEPGIYATTDGEVGAVVSARLSSEHGGYSAPPDHFSDVTLEVNGAEQGTHTIVPDDGKGRRYGWRVAPQSLVPGWNDISFVVKPGAQHRNGIAIYHIPFSSELEPEYIEYVLVSGAEAGAPGPIAGSEVSDRLASSAARPVPANTDRMAERHETLRVPWTVAGGVGTDRSYSGYVQLTISGVGTASGRNLNDAFYVVEEKEAGCETTFGMHIWLISQHSPTPLPVANLIPEGCPDFNPDHVYRVIIDLKDYEGPLAFGTGDTIVSDNSGELTVNLTPTTAPKPAPTPEPEPFPTPAPVVQAEGPSNEVVITPGRPPDMTGQLAYDTPACPRDVPQLRLREDTDIEEMVDLDVLYVERHPVYGYRQAKTWPDVGQYVTYTAYVANRGGVSTGEYAQEVTVSWEMVSPSGGVLLSHKKDYEVELRPNAVAEFKLGWLWQDGPNRLTVRVSPREEMPEWTTVNNSVEIFTNALLIGFAFEESFYDWMSSVMNGDIEDSYHDSINWDVGRFNWFTRDSSSPPHRPEVFGAESWAQRQIEQMNEYIRKAEDDYFEGVRHSLPRVALQALPVVPDSEMEYDNSALPTDGPWGDLDMVWGFEATRPIDDCPTPGPQGFWTWFGYYKPQFRNVEDPLIHELGHHMALRHEREIYGEYQFPPGTFPFTLDERSSAAGTPYTFIGDRGEIFSVMQNTGYFRGFSKYNAHTLAYRFQHLPGRDVPSRIGAINGGGGNWIPSGFGNYWDDYGTNNVWDWVWHEQPDKVRLTVVDRWGNPVSGTQVELYALAPPRRDLFGKTPVIIEKTSVDGTLVVDPTLLFPTGEGHPRTAVAVVRFGDVEFVRILSLADINLDFWTGSSESVPAMKLDGTRDGFPTLLIGSGPLPNLSPTVTLPLDPAANTNWDLSGASTIDFWIMAENPNPIGFQNGFTLVLGDTEGNAFEYASDVTLLNEANGRWTSVSIPLEGGRGWQLTTRGDPSLDDIDYVEIHADTWGDGFALWVDGLRLGDLPPDEFTEGNAHLWATEAEDARPTFADDDPENARVGDYSLLLVTEGGFDTTLRYPAGGGALSVTCVTSPFPGRAGEAVTWLAVPSGGNGEYTVTWRGTDGLAGSGLQVVRTYGNAGFKQAWVTFESAEETQEVECGHFHVLPRTFPEPPTVNPVLWAPKGIDPDPWVPQMERNLREIQAAFHNVLGKTFAMNPLVVVRSGTSEQELCGGDCEDMEMDDKVMQLAWQEAQDAVGEIIPYTREVLVMAWGAGGWAGAYGWHFPLAGVGDWAIGGSVGLPQNPINDFNGGIYTIGHELGHNISWDDPHGNDFLRPETVGEFDRIVSQGSPWLYVSLNDTKPPEVRIEQVRQTSSGVDVRASATDNDAVEAVALIVDGELWEVDTTAPFSFFWDTSGVYLGPHLLTVKAYDFTGNTAEVRHMVDLGQG